MIKLYCHTFNSAKGKKDDWPDEESDKELKIEASEDDELVIPLVKSKGE